MVEKEKIRKLIFSKWYQKLANNLFITLRKRPQCVVGEKTVVRIKNDSEEFLAKCLMVIPLQLDEISDELLIFDTDTNSREKAIVLLQSFYKKKISGEDKFYLHIMQRVKR